MINSNPSSPLPFPSIKELLLLYFSELALDPPWLYAPDCTTLLVLNNPFCWGNIWLTFCLQTILLNKKKSWNDLLQFEKESE